MFEDGFSEFTDIVFGQFERGSGDIEQRVEVLQAATRELHKRLQAAHRDMPAHGETWRDYGHRHANAEAISDAATLCLTVLKLISPHSEGDLRAVIRHRSSNRPVDWAKREARLRKDNHLAKLVERLVVERPGRADRQKEWAVLTVSDKRNVSRKRIYEALARRRAAREVLPDASEREILSLLLM